ncbi:SNAP25 homologous protein SNAP33-like [Salvia miltiorrhiza]|uniref:SNAP25 homologous protein SNAP33-like n=1 Tax=Salvia miltiorrhiza TaxID=226208 RepID=UPI0025AD5E26|nr:SNAP25 homologous protein SNAP33-like [Salvia miltiorrhiza]
MFGHKKSPLHRFSRHKSADPSDFPNHQTNPFESNDELKSVKDSGRTSSEPALVTPDFNSNPFDDDGNDVRGTSSSQSFFNSSARNKYKNDFRDSGGLESQTVEELENYAVYKAEDTTKTVNSCLKIAEDMREEATNTLVMLHQQGEQITRTHTVAADIEYDLSRGEKLLGSLGGMFSKTWKPKKNRAIKGPSTTRGDPVQRKGNHLEQRERLGLSSASKERSSNARKPLSDPTDALQKVEVEKGKQDDALVDLSNILGELKNMAIDMGSEIEGQNKALDHAEDDMDELVYRVKGANQRTRRLLGK